MFTPAQFAATRARIYVVTPQGQLSKYFLRYRIFAEGTCGVGAGGGLRTTRSAKRLSIRFLLFCYHFESGIRESTPVVALNILARGPGAATVLTLGGFVFIMLRRDHRAEREIEAA